MRILERLSRVQGIRWYLGALGMALALAFAFLVYPAIDDAQHAVLDPDLHGPLGFGIWKYHTFSYYPSHFLSAARGPLYPAFIAALLASTGGWWPYSIQLAQCILFGLMCVLVFWTTENLWNARLAVLASGLCAIDPFLIWYTSRIWVEPVMMVLFTVLFASIVLLKQRPTVWRAVLVGFILSLSVMTKSIYTPFLVLTPLLLLLPFGKPIRPLLALTVLIVGVALVMPWTLRNGEVTGIYAPEVGATGYTLHQGNDFVEDFARAPFAESTLHRFSVQRMRDEEDDVVYTPDMTQMQRINTLDAARRRVSIDKLVHSPGFFVKKIAYGLVLFWTFGDSAVKSLIIALCQLPVLALFCTCVVVRRRELGAGALGIGAALIALYYFAHLPTIALARYSVVLVPVMLTIGVGLFRARTLVSNES